MRIVINLCGLHIDALATFCFITLVVFVPNVHSRTTSGTSALGIRLDIYVLQRSLTGHYNSLIGIFKLSKCFCINSYPPYMHMTNQVRY